VRLVRGLECVRRPKIRSLGLHGVAFAGYHVCSIIKQRYTVYWSSFCGIATIQKSLGLCCNLN